MKRLHNRRSRRNENLCQLPLFAWALAQPLHNRPHVVTTLSRRFGFSASLAITVAELAGLSVEADHA
jgi:hypothetical protein